MVVLLVFLTLCVMAAVSYQRNLSQKTAIKSLTESVYFHPGHTWVSFQEDGLAKIGIDRFMRGILGKFDEIVFPSNGRLIKKNEPIFSVSKEGKQVNFISPIDGIVIKRNLSVSDGAAYKDDYMLVLRPTKVQDNMEKAIKLKDSDSWFSQEYERFSDFASAYMNPSGVGMTMADGGKYKNGIIEYMDKETLKSFNREFLHG